MRILVLFLTVIAVAAIAAEPQIVPIVRVPQTSNHTMASWAAPVTSVPTSSIDPAALWQPLTRMSPQERANGELVVTANSSEVREAEAMWNRGEYDAAIAVLQRWAEKADLRHVYVGFNWRVPIQSHRTDWDTNIRVGTRDSAYRVVLDRNNSTGNLMVVSVGRGGPLTNLFAYLSTDGGSTWAETHYGYWDGSSIVADLEMAGSGGFEYAVILFSTTPEWAYVYRCDAATGAYVKLPDSSWYKPVLGTSVPGDTLNEVAITSSDDQYAGQSIYVVGGTRQHLVEAGWTDDQGANWGLYTALTDMYWGGLDYCYNHYDTPGDRYVFFSCLYSAATQMYPGFAYYDSAWTGWYISDSTYHAGIGQTTAIAAWKDTIFLVYPRGTTTGTAVRRFISYNAGTGFAQTVDLTDSAYTRENVAICGRLGDGVGVAWREYGDGGDRWIFQRHSDYAGTSWTGPDTVSDYTPDVFERARIQRVAAGVQGICYIAKSSGSLWFSRNDLTGITSPRPELAVPMDLAAAPHRCGAWLSFTNPLVGPVTLKVYDASGRLVLGRTHQLKPGAQTLDCAVPASGSYVVVLKTAAATATTKFSTLK